jgi:hypothetical protein
MIPGKRRFFVIDILLDDINHDFVLENGDFVLIDGIDSIKQGLKIRLGIISTEWFLDKNIGVIDLSSDKPDPDDTVNRIKSEVMKEEGVVRISSFSSDFNAETRVLNVDFVVNTIYGDAEIEQGVGI